MVTRLVFKIYRAGIHCKTHNLHTHARPLHTNASMRVVIISDTHSHHKKLRELPQGDMLIHAGDFTASRPPRPEEYTQFMDWFVSQPHKHKVLISGNRDQYMDTHTSSKDYHSMTTPLGSGFLPYNNM